MDNTSSNLINVKGTLSGSINGVAINGTVTGTADRSTGHVTNVYHGIDPEIGQELSQIVLGLTIVCANMAVEQGVARNLDSMAPKQSMQRLAIFKLPSHTMECRQTVSFSNSDEAVVSMEYSGELPPFSKGANSIPDVVSEFRQTGPQTIQQSGKTEAVFDGKPLPLSVEIQYIMDGSKIAWSSLAQQFLENSNNTSSYDETTKEIIYNTDVRMLESM